MLSERVGEVIESRTTAFVAQCYRLHEPPPLGSLVKVKGGHTEVFAVVSDVSTTPIQPGRRPVARGMEESNQEEIFNHNPQLEKLLRTIFQAQIVGFTPVEEGSGKGRRVFQHLPPQPPRIHAFVHQCDRDEAVGFASSVEFLNILVRADAPARDEVILACLNSLGTGLEDGHQLMVKAGKELSQLLAGEPQRLNVILKGLRR